MRAQAPVIQRRALTAQNKKDLILVGIIVLLFAVFSIIANGFFDLYTVMNIIKQSAAIGIAAYGMTFIMLTGGIDLAAGSSLALVGAVAALVMKSVQGSGGSEISVFLSGFMGTVLAACLVQAVSGFIIGFLGVNAFIATLAMSYMARGLAMTLMRSDRVLVSNSIYTFFGQKSLFSFRMPASFLLIIVMFFIAHLLLSRTKFGRRTYAIGGNPVAAEASGINVKLQTFWVYVLSGLFIAMATMINIGRARSAQPYAGTGFEFSVITAAVLGGCSLTGGVGNIRSTTLGIIALGIITTGLNMFSVTPFFDYLIKGGLILGAVLLNKINFNVGTGVKSSVYSAHRRGTASKEVFDTEQRGVSHTLEFRHITKAFPGVVALDDVSLTVAPGTVHAICGENGAGKSTLVKILSGVYTKDEGELLIDGKQAIIRSPIDSKKMGIAVIYQELSTVPELNVYQNMFLGKEILTRIRPFINRKRMNREAAKLLKQQNLELNINRRIGDYTVGQQQMVEIAKAVGANAWLLVMDEPTSAITETDKENLFRIIKELKNRGISIIYITHRMQEIMQIADEVTVLRDGSHIATLPIAGVDEKKLIKMMIGREVSDIYNRDKNELGEVVLEVRNLYRRGVFEPISFIVREREVLGFSGLIGAGRTEIMRCLFGLDKADGGEVLVRGNLQNIRSAKDTVNAGIVLISEDRRREGIIPLMTVRENCALPSLDSISNAGWVNQRREKDIAITAVESLDIKTPSIEQLITNLSGGNQQKVCVGKWLAMSPQVIIMDEPTRGIDIGAKEQIHKTIAELTRKNMAVILISSEMQEIIGASDRIMVLYKGKLMAEFPVNAQLTQEIIMTAASGIDTYQSIRAG
jgi:ribose transport system ATP-binding protein